MPLKHIIFVAALLFATFFLPEVFYSGRILELPHQILKIQMPNTQYFVKVHGMVLTWSQGWEQVVSFNAST